MRSYTYEQVSGMNTADILLRVSAENLAQFSRSEQAKIVSKLAKTANARRESLKRARRKDLYSAAYETIRGKPRFSVKGKGSKALINEFNRARGFLFKPSSTVKGARKLQRGIIEAAEDRGYEISEKQAFDVGNMWGAVKNSDAISRMLPLFESDEINDIIVSSSKSGVSLDEVLKKVAEKVDAEEDYNRELAEKHHSIAKEFKDDEDQGDWLI